MTEIRQLLLIETLPADAEEICRVLHASCRYRVKRVKTLALARKQLQKEAPALVVASARLPDGQAIDLLRDDPSLPLILLGEAGDCATVVETIKAGALDYLPRSAETIAQLTTIVDRVLKEAAQRHAEQRAIDYAAQFGRLLASSLTEIYTFHATTLHFIRANRGALENLGYSKQELRRLTPFDLKPELGRDTLLAWLDELRSGHREAIRFETRHRRKDGSFYPVDVHLQYSQTEPPVFVAVILDISERKRTEEQLQSSEARFRSIFDSAAAGLAILSPEGEILEVNPYFCEFTGYPAAEMLAHNIIEFTHPDDRKQTGNYYAALQQDPQQIITIEKRYLRKDGQVRWGHASITCIPDHSGAAPYCIGLVQDISRHKDSEEKMRDAYAELDAFVHTVAHDLRNPLTPIIGMAEFLQEHSSEVLDETAIDFLHDIETSALKMLALLEDLLALSRVGHIRTPAAPVKVKQIVEEVLLNLGSHMAAAGLTARVGDLSPLCLPGTLVSQLFDNLISNAIRYAGHPGSTIDIEERLQDTRLVLLVRDHGPGIPEAERNRVFEVFYRGSTSDGTRGTGIGLATVHKIARLYGGDVFVEETPGGGCTFRIELPRSILSHQVGQTLVC